MPRSLRRRVIEPEILDTVAPSGAVQSLKDLVKLNRRFGGHSALRSVLERAAVSTGEPFTVLDVGAASGDMGREIRRLYPAAMVTSLDYLASHLKSADPPRLVANAFQLPFQANSYDFVFTSLFLHHFTDIQIIELLRQFGAVARKGVLVVDLHRQWLAYWFVPATRWILGWDSITVHDAPVSVAAAFRTDELEELARCAEFNRVDVKSHGLTYRLTLFANHAEGRTAPSGRGSVNA